MRVACLRSHRRRATRRPQKHRTASKHAGLRTDRTKRQKNAAKWTARGEIVPSVWPEKKIRGASHRPSDLATRQCRTYHWRRRSKRRAQMRLFQCNLRKKKQLPTFGRIAAVATLSSTGHFIFFLYSTTQCRISRRNSRARSRTKRTRQRRPTNRGRRRP